LVDHGLASEVAKRAKLAIGPAPALFSPKFTQENPITPAAGGARRARRAGIKLAALGDAPQSDAF